MPKQMTFASLAKATNKNLTRREKFVSEMEAVVPWSRLLVLIKPHYPKMGIKGGRPAMPLDMMLQIYCLQQWYALSDPMDEESLHGSEAMRRFSGLELGDDRNQDETTILNFRHLLERHALTEAIFAEVNAHLAEKGVKLRSGTLVDATIIDAPSSTKNKADKRDPEMTGTKKGIEWYFGMKEHIGVDTDVGIVHSLEASMAKVHDSQVWDELLHGGEASVWADKVDVNAERAAAIAGPDKFWDVMRKAPKGGMLHPIDELINHLISKVRSRVEHPFRVLKRQFGYLKTRYRGLANNRALLFSLFAPGNLYLVRKRLMA